jgi:hypothetical protein
MTPPLSVVCYDLAAVARMCRSIAMTVALQRHTRTEWVRYTDSAVLNALYGAMFWKAAPGTVEVRQDSARLEATAFELQEHYLHVWMRKLQECGPRVATNYLNQMVKVRDDARDDLRRIFAEVDNLNNEIRGENAEAIKNLARIKLGATVGVAAMGVGGAIVLSGGAALVATGVSAGYSMSCAFVKEYENGIGAEVAAVSIEAGKATASEVLGWGAGVVGTNALAREANASMLLKQFTRTVEVQSNKLARLATSRPSAKVLKSINKAKSSLGRATEGVGAQQGARQSARLLGRTASVATVGVPVVFALWDIWDSVTDYNETIAGLD